MVLQINRKERVSLLSRCGVLLIAAVFISLMICGPSHAKTVKQRTFASPEEAVNALVETAKLKDIKALEAIFGPGSKDLVSSGDPVSDGAGFDRFVKRYEEKHRLQEVSDEKSMLYLGNDDWPLAIPIVKKNASWYFDTEEGRTEILARRIGKNEMSTIQACLAYVDAQREYAFEDRDGDALPEYAQKFWSDPGKQNGLYWETKIGEKQSPLGPLVAAAEKKGYTKKGDKPLPYNGYYYRILKAQGKSAAGGAYDYLVKGKMIGGFAMVAYPAKYASSGVMTFIVNHDGVVYQKDLGSKTGNVAQAIKIYDPDSTWEKVHGKDLKADNK